MRQKMINSSRVGDKVGVSVERAPQLTPQRKICKSLWRQHHVKNRQKSQKNKQTNKQKHTSQV